jgi:predicted ATPase
VSAVSRRLQRHRFVTIVGPGGIGKTAVALVVAGARVGAYRDGAHVVDLAPVRDPRLVPSALGSMLGVAIRSDNPYPALASYLRRKQMLLVFDNCEHVVQAAAVLAEEALKSSPDICILATSREPLRAQAENVQRLAALETTPRFTGLTAAAALKFTAVQLFVERAAASAGGYELTDSDAPVVAQICHRLDGIALAIELAASRVDTFGAAGVAARLDDRFRLLTHGRRTAVPRHRTLGATLDWSYELLSDAERTVLRRLGIFAGRFTIEAARAVAGGAAGPATSVDDIVANLVEKSLLVADIGSETIFYRLLDTGQAYALQKLRESGELQALEQRHARYQRDLIQRAELEWETQTTAEWLATYSPQIDDLRKALDWAHSPAGDAVLGIELAAASVPLWCQMSLIEECRSRTEHALTALESGAIDDNRRKMQLHAAIALSQMYTY